MNLEGSALWPLFSPLLHQMGSFTEGTAKLQNIEVVVHVNNLVLAIDGSCCYLSVIIRTFKYQDI